jgi:hypothetical protein
MHLDSRFRGTDGVGLSTLLTNFDSTELRNIEAEDQETSYGSPAVPLIGSLDVRALARKCNLTWR